MSTTMRRGSRAGGGAGALDRLCGAGRGVAAPEPTAVQARDLAVDAEHPLIRAVPRLVPAAVHSDHPIGTGGTGGTDPRTPLAPDLYHVRR